MLEDLANESVFALKGGTAINLFYRDMGRLSVDIDLTYLPVADRRSSLGAIDAALERLFRQRPGPIRSVTLSAAAAGYTR